MNTEITRVCRECQTAFEISQAEADFFLSPTRRLALPTRCKDCRAERAFVRDCGIVGVVERYDENWRNGLGIIRTNTGERVIVASHSITEPFGGPLARGQRVVLEIEPGSPLRRGADVRVIETDDRR